MSVYFLLVWLYIIYKEQMAREPENLQQKNETPLEYLYHIANDESLPPQVRMDAAKALLPYTAKKTAETLETVNRNYVVKDERLAALSDDELRTLFELVTKVTEPGVDGAGATEKEVQLD